MNKVDSVSLACGEALLDFVVSSAPEIRGVCDVDDDRACRGSEDVYHFLGVGSVDCAPIFEYLLREELVFERDLSERGYLVEPPLRNGLVFVADEHLHVSCRVGAIVDQEDGGCFSIVFDPPLVDRLVGCDAQRSLADRIRVCAYLVRLACKVVGVIGEPLRVDGDPVGFLRESVRRLRDLVAVARLHQGDDPGDASKRSNGRANGRDDVPDAFHENKSTALADAVRIKTEETTALADGGDV